MSFVDPDLLDKWADDAKRKREEMETKARSVGGHTREICACGAVIRQCRCIGPHIDIASIEQCAACKANPQRANDSRAKAQSLAKQQLKLLVDAATPLDQMAIDVMRNTLAWLETQLKAAT